MKKIISVTLILIIITMFFACGKNGSSTNSSDTSKKTSSNEEIILNPPVTVIDNEIATLTITRFFNEVYNEGAEDEYWWSGFEMDVTNNMDKYYLDVSINNASLADQRVIEFAVNRSSKVMSGKTAVFKFIKMDQNKFEDLNALYELEGIFDLSVTDDSYSYSKIGGNTPFSIAESMGKTAN